MRKLGVFNQVTLDGYFTSPEGDMSWAHKDPNDKEWNEFVAGNASNGGMLLFGRVTYEMMASYWPTRMAAKNNPEVAKGMNEMPKVVFSKTMKKPEWSNTTLVKTDIVAAVRKMKQEPGPNMVILGSGTIVSQLAQARLIDEYQVVVNPLVLGDGRTMFEGVDRLLDLKLTKSKAFGNGSVVLWYEASA